MGGRGVYRVLFVRLEGRRPVERTRRSWEDNIMTDLREIGIDGTNRILLAQIRVKWRAFVNTVMNFEFHKESRLLYDKLSDYQLFKEYPPWSK
jgi:hypothetical protein